ncbi:hypothetical protein ACWDA3_57710 [Nonomuraea rubra]
MASVAYGPEAIVLVLALAGGAGLGFTIPVTLTIAALLAVLTFSYRQVIAAPSPRAEARTGWPGPTSDGGPAWSRGRPW